MRSAEWTQQTLSVPARTPRPSCSQPSWCGATDPDRGIRNSQGAAVLVSSPPPGPIGSQREGVKAPWSSRPAWPPPALQTAGVGEERRTQEAIVFPKALLFPLLGHSSCWTAAASW